MEAITIPAIPPRAPGRVRPILALRGLVRVLFDPEDTEAGALFVRATDGAQPERNFQRFAADPIGARILAEGRSLPALLCDRDGLRARPSGSLARRYLAFVEEESISAEGLTEATAPVRLKLGAADPARILFEDRLSVMHDLWHVLLGYSRDILGEVQVLAFSHEQLHTRAFGWLLSFGAFFNERQAPGTRALIALARERARRAPWFPALDWESLLPQPLDRIRESLQVGSPPHYRRYFKDPHGLGLVAEPETADRHALQES